jgi:hypothetical protein
MEDVKKLFKELYYEIFKIVFLNALLESVIFFLVAHIILSFLNFSYHYSLTITLVFISVNIAFRMKKIKLKYVEDKNPSIKEILRTARDSYGEDNFMVRACFEDLVTRMKEASSGNMLSAQSLLLKVSLIIVLCFVLIISSPYFVDLPGIVSDLNLPDWNGKHATSINANEIYGIEFNESEDIYGESSVAILGNEEVELRINPELNEINLNEVKPIEEKTFQAGQFPGDISAVADTLSEEKIPEESKIAIAYNLKLKES